MLDPRATVLIRQLDPAVRRSFDASELNRIVNDPDVLASIGTVDQVDLSEVVANPANVLLMTDGGAMLFMRDEPGIYEVHSSFLKNCRGRHAVEAARNAAHWMFTGTDCMSIQTRVPKFNRQASMAVTAVGFSFLFERHGVWPVRPIDGNTQPLADVRFYELTYARWLQNAKADRIEAGRWFHSHLEIEMARHGVTEPQHPDEDCHDHYVGACVEMIRAEQPEKGIVLYNRWARLAGYQQVALVARSPLVIDIGTAVLVVEKGDFKVVKCRQQP